MLHQHCRTLVLSYRCVSLEPWNRRSWFPFKLKDKRPNPPPTLLAENLIINQICFATPTQQLFPSWNTAWSFYCCFWERSCLRSDRHIIIILLCGNTEATCWRCTEEQYIFNANKSWALKASQAPLQITLLAYSKKSIPKISLGRMKMLCWIFFVMSVLREIATNLNTLQFVTGLLTAALLAQRLRT